MAERVAVGRIIVGHGDQRRTIAPGTRFNTEDAGISSDDLKAMDASGVLRRPRDTSARAAADGGPPVEPVEGRSGPATGARSPAAQETDQSEENPEHGTTGAESGDESGGKRRGRRAKSDDIDEL